jgi:iron complex outermembrane receptor protein
MTRSRVLPGLLVTALLTGADAAPAATTTTNVSGTFGATAQGCLQLLTQFVGNGENCMYGRGNPSGIAPPIGEVTGPFAQVHYYDSVATPQAFSPAFVPTHASGQISQVITGSISIDDNGTPANGGDDLLSFSLTMRSPGSGDVIRHLGDSVVDRYTSMTQVLAPRAVDSATPNGFGGFDYVIGSEGFPVLLTFDSPTEPDAVPCKGQPFGFMDCDGPAGPASPAAFSSTTTDPDRWPGTSRPGLSSLEGNLGARTTGTVENLACIGTDGQSPPNDCFDSKVSFAPLVIGPNQAPNGVTAEDVGWDQLVLKVSTDGSGRVLSYAGFDVQEYQVFGPNAPCGSDPGAAIPCNTWVSGFFYGPAGFASDDGPVRATAGVELIIDALLNDVGFADPVTVTISTPPPKGVAEVQVNGSAGTSGNRADIRIAYTANGGASGTDSFTYQITDGISTGYATVFLNLDAPADLFPSIDIWDIATDQDHESSPFVVGQFIVYGNGNPDQHAVTVTTQAANGTCAINPENGTGQFVYTPNAGFSGTDSCTVTVTDVDSDSAADTVAITVNPLNAATPDIGGASALDLWGLLLLGAPLLGRRRRAAGAVPRCRRRVAALAAAALALGAGGAAAQDAEPAGDSLAIEEIVVTARKVEENIKEVPVAVTAFDESSIEAAGITSLTDVAALTPGLSFFNAIGGSLPVPVIRGVAPTDIFGENNAAIFVDGVYVSGREGLNFSQLDVERIEVVKGPQSALYGRNAFSGAINYVTKRPSEEFEAKALVESGNEDRRKGSASVSGPLLGDSLRGRAAVLYDEWDGSYSNSIPGGPDIGGYRYRSYQGSLLWLPTDSVEVDLAYYASNDALDEPTVIGVRPNCEDRVEPPPDTADNPIQPGTRFQNFCGEIPDLDALPGMTGDRTMPKIREALGENRDLDRASLKIDWDLYERGSVTALTGYSKTSQNQRLDFGRGTGYDQPFLYCSPATSESPQVPNACIDQNGVPTPANQIFFSGLLDEEPGDVTEEWSQELRWTSPQDQRLRVTGGAYWYTVNLRHKEGNPIAVTADGASPLPSGTFGLAPFDPSAPNFAIGTAIFYGSFADNPFTPGYDPDGGSTPDPLRRVNDERDTEAWALFSGADFDLTERLTLRGELRVSQESKEAKTNAYTPCPQTGYAVPDPNNPAAVIPNPCGDDLVDLRVVAPETTYSGSARFDQITGRIGLKFQVNDDWMTYGSISRGEKPGGVVLLIEPLAPDPVTGVVEDALIVDEYDPEKITAYEVGAKGYLFDRRLSLDVAVFYNDWTDIVFRQLLENDPTTGRPLEQPASDNINAADATVLGAEVQAAFNITEHLSGDVTFSWTDAELDDARQDTYARFPSFRADCDAILGPPPGTPDANKDWFSSCNALSGDVSGNTLLRQPEWKSSASLTYRRPLDDQWQWYLRGDVNYQGDVYVGNENEGWLPARTVVNTKTGLDSGRYRFEFWVRNLFDDRKPIAAYRDIWFTNTDNVYPPFVDQGPRPSFDDFVPWRLTTTYADGRTFGITAEMRFGAAAP